MAVEIVIRLKEQGSARKTTEELDDLRGAAHKAKDGMTAFGQVTTGALRQIGGSAVDLLARAGQAMLAFVGDSLNAAGDYEQSMNVFQEQSGATAAQMDLVKSKAKELGSDLSLPATSAADAGTAMLELSKAGMEVEESMDAAKGTLQLAAAAQIDEANAASITANALNTFHMEASKATYVADLLAATANASSANITDLSQGLQQGGFAFQAAGQGIDDLAASLAILTNVGLTGSDAGTAIKNAFLQMMGPTDQARDKMQELGISFHDAQGNMLPLREIIGVLNNALSGLSQEERNTALKTIFLGDGMKGLLPLLDAGVEAFDEMKAKVNDSGAAARLAGAQMQGWKGAVAGLTSQLETLMLEVLEPILPVLTAGAQQAAGFAASLIGKVGPAVQTAIDVGGVLIDVVQTGLVPALGAAAVATVLWAAANAGALLTALATAAPQIIAATSAVMANAAAVAAAAAPYLLIGAAVAAVAVHWTAFNNKIEDGTQALLNSHPAWVATTDALTSYNNQSAETQAQLASHAGTIKVLREQIEGEIESLALRDAAGLVSDEQREREKTHINELGGALTVATNAYRTEEQALIAAAAAELTATQYAADLAAGTAQVGGQALLTAEDLEKLRQKVEETFQKGAEAVGAYVTTAAGFLGTLEAEHAGHQERMRALLVEKEKAKTEEQRAQIQERIAAEQAAFQAQMQNQALAYAQEAAAQRAHLGQMLIDYTLVQNQMGNITDERAAAIVSTIESKFGIVSDISATTFLAMTQDIDRAGREGGAAMARLGGDLDRAADDAVTTRQKMDELAKQYTAEILADFDPAKDNADELRRKLEAIPSRVYTEVVTRNIYIEERRSSGQEGGLMGERATGGPVMAGEPYLVGERGPEVVVPGSSGTVIPNDQLAIGGTTNNYFTVNYTGQAADEGSVSDSLRVLSVLYR